MVSELSWKGLCKAFIMAGKRGHSGKISASGRPNCFSQSLQLSISVLAVGIVYANVVAGEAGDLLLGASTANDGGNDYLG